VPSPSERGFPNSADATLPDAECVARRLHSAGTAAGGLFTGVGAWWALPLLIVLLIALLLMGTLQAPLRLPYSAASGPVGQIPSRLWLYAAVVLLYGVAETLCGNWATLYLSTAREVRAQQASFALTAFWVMVTLGRLIVAFLDRFVAARWLYLALPILLAIAFQVVSRADGAGIGIAGFADAGLACSAFLPFSISFAGAEFPRQAAICRGR